MRLGSKNREPAVDKTVPNPPEVPDSRQIVYKSSRVYRQNAQRRSTVSTWCVVLVGITSFIALAGEWMKTHFPTLTWTEFLHVLEYPFENRPEDVPRFLVFCVLPAALAMIVCGVLCTCFREKRHFVMVTRIVVLIFLALSLFLIFRFASFYHFIGSNHPFINFLP